MAAQGELFLVRVNSIPKNAKKAKAVDGKFICGHSETGHHHVVDAKSAVMYDTDDAMVSYLNVEKETKLTHERGFDTHQPLTLLPGVYKIQRQREFTPEGWRAVAD